MGRSRILSYRMEYFSPEWPRNSLGWLVFADDIAAHTNFYTAYNLIHIIYLLYVLVMSKGMVLQARLQNWSKHYVSIFLNFLNYK